MIAWSQSPIQWGAEFIAEFLRPLGCPWELTESITLHCNLEKLPQVVISAIFLSYSVILWLNISVIFCNLVKAIYLSEPSKDPSCMQEKSCKTCGLKGDVEIYLPCRSRINNTAQEVKGLNLAVTGV